ncbi:MAG TPA: nuclear transport factor 2 family protein [Caulobacter sp.]|nr:nuclear transport factor 2 family protein [Caulobacter sp.]
MPSRARFAEFVATVEAGRFVEAIERFYASNATSQENLGLLTRGREAFADKERAALERSGIATVAGSVALLDGDRTAVNWRFEITGPNGVVRTLDEIAWQRWEGEHIVEERFYYDPAQLRG